MTPFLIFNLFFFLFGVALIVIALCMIYLR